MLTSILGAQLSWYQADGWVFDPVTVGPRDRSIVVRGEQIAADVANQFPLRFREASDALHVVAEISAKYSA